MHQKRRDFIINELNNGVRVSEIAISYTVYCELDQASLILAQLK